VKQSASAVRKKIHQPMKTLISYASVVRTFRYFCWKTFFFAV